MESLPQCDGGLWSTALGKISALHNIRAELHILRSILYVLILNIRESLETNLVHEAREKRQACTRIANECDGTSFASSDHCYLVNFLLVWQEFWSGSVRRGMHANLQAHPVTCGCFHTRLFCVRLDHDFGGCWRQIKCDITTRSSPLCLKPYFCRVLSLRQTLDILVSKCHAVWDEYTFP